MLYARLGRIQVQASVLDVLVDFLGSLQERVLHVLSTAREQQELLGLSAASGGSWADTALGPDGHCPVLFQPNNPAPGQGNALPGHYTHQHQPGIWNMCRSSEEQK